MRSNCVALAVWLLCSAAPVGAQLSFSEVGTSRGLLPVAIADGMGAGVAAADFDDDGDVDLFVPNRIGVADQLYRNQGAGTFREIASAAGVASTESARVALFIDYDGDERLDLLVAGDCFNTTSICTTLRELRLYRQVADAVFIDVTTQAGLDVDFLDGTDQHVGSLAAGDLDGDGFLDFQVAVWVQAGSTRTRVFMNNGDGTFSDATATSGIASTADARWQAMLHDFDGDGRQDVYQAVDFTANHLWTNQGVTFVDEAPTAGADNAFNDMGLSLGDPDNDGDLDVYISNIETPSTHNVLLRNDSVGAALSFQEISQASGCANASWSWGTTFLDADNDGWLDIAATNGFFNAPYDTDTSRFFRNQAASPLSFSDDSAAVGFDDSFWGSALIALDADRDGDLDLVQTTNPGPLRLLDNQLVTADHHLVIQPRMFGPNRRAIGAVVRVNAAGSQMMRLIHAGTSFMGQEPAEAFFGLGGATQADDVTVEWPDGTGTVLTNVAADQVLIIEPETCFDPVDSDADGIGDRCDPDDDNDGLLDIVETGTGTFIDATGTGSNRLDPDTDGDGVADGVEVAAGTDPNDPNDLPPSIPMLSGSAYALLLLTLLLAFPLAGRSALLQRPIPRV